MAEAFIKVIFIGLLLILLALGPIGWITLIILVIYAELIGENLYTLFKE